MLLFIFRKSEKEKQHVCTCDRGEEDAHQHSEGGGDVSKHIRLMGGCWMCGLNRDDGALLHHIPFAKIGAPHVLYKNEIQYVLVSRALVFDSHEVSCESLIYNEFRKSINVFKLFAKLSKNNSKGIQCSIYTGCIQTQYWV